MKRSNDTVSTRVYSYGTVPPRIAPVRGEGAADNQLKLANRLWNTLVAIERTRMERYRKIMRDETQARIDELRAEASVIREEIKQRRKAVRSKHIEDAPARDRLRAIKDEMSALIERQCASKDARHAAKRQELDKLNELHKHRIVRARQASAHMGLYWGTYNDIIQRADAGRKLGDLHFRRFAHDGTLTAQIIGGATVARCVDRPDHSFFQIDLPTAGRKWRYTRMRIGSTADLSPVWLEIPIVYHRNLPPAGLIKSVSMTRRKDTWQLNVTVNQALPMPSMNPHTIAVDIGWRLLPDGVRVAYWCDDRGRDGQLVVPATDIQQLEKVEHLRSICDLARDEFLPSLVAWLQGRELGEEWQIKTRAIAQWKSARRVADLIAWWREHRLDGDDEIYAEAQRWRKQFLHLDNWRGNLEDQIRLRIREQYRIFAADTARQYGHLCIEDFDLREVAQLPAPESRETTTASSGYRHKVSPSVFRACLINACAREGLRITRIPAAHTTHQCHACGTMEVWDQAADLIHRCKCGELWDQDYNAARNLLKLGQEDVVGAVA